VNAAPFGLAVSHPMTGVSVVTVSGDLEMTTTPALLDVVRAELAAGAQCLLIDLDAVDFLGSAGMTALLEASRALAGAVPGAMLHLSGTSRRVVHRPLEMLGLLPLFIVHADLDEALAKIESAERA